MARILLPTIGEMTDTPVRLRVPVACVSCGARGTIKLQQTIKGESVVLEWNCSICNAEWPVRRQDEQSLD
jgi:hypothetical protein